MVEQLEEAADETEGTSLGDELPSGDELAAELERFLRGEAELSRRASSTSPASMRSPRPSA